jgi:hypothetical protein
LKMASPAGLSSILNAVHGAAARPLRIIRPSADDCLWGCRRPRSWWAGVRGGMVRCRVASAGVGRR